MLLKAIKNRLNKYRAADGTSVETTSEKFCSELSTCYLLNICADRTLHFQKLFVQKAFAVFLKNRPI